MAIAIALAILFGASPGPAMNSQAGFDLSVVRLEHQGSTVLLEIDARNPVIRPRAGLMVELPCRSRDGAALRLRGVATAPDARARSEELAARHGASDIVVSEKGFPAQATVRLLFHLRAPAAVEAGSCGRPVLSGAW